MGRTVYWMNVSLDLRIEHAHNEQGAGTWMRIDDELHRVFNERARRLALAVEGRVIFETMEAFWPAAATDPSSSDVIREYGHIWTSAKKILVSNSRREAPHNTTVLGGPDVAGDDASVAVEEGAARAEDHGVHEEQEFVEEPALQQLRRDVCAADANVAVGVPAELGEAVEDLVEQAAFKSGVTMQRYAIRR